MIIALDVLLLLGVLGALDTLYYHEWRLQLPGRPSARRELRLHASRDFAYAVIFASLAWYGVFLTLLYPHALQQVARLASQANDRKRLHHVADIRKPELI